MGSVPSKVGVFFGKANREAEGWYWTDGSISRKRKAAITGPFETKEKAVENAAQSQRQIPNDEPAISRQSSVSPFEIIAQRPFPLRSRTPERRPDFWTRVRIECRALLATRSGPRRGATGRATPWVSDDKRVN
jgi:hypothetical protein